MTDQLQKMDDKTKDSPSPEKIKAKPPKLDISKALQLKVDNNLSYQQISDITGVPKSTIHKAIQDLLPTEETKTYQQNRADILSNIQCKIIKSIDDADIKKAPFGSRILAMAQLIDKERLERGLSTQNLASIHADIAALQQEDNPDGS